MRPVKVEATLVGRELPRKGSNLDWFDKKRVRKLYVRVLIGLITGVLITDHVVLNGYIAFLKRYSVASVSLRGFSVYDDQPGLSLSQLLYLKVCEIIYAIN